MKLKQKKINIKYNYMSISKDDLAIIGEMVNITSEKFLPEKCGDIIINNINKNPKHSISMDWDKIKSFIKKLEKCELKAFGFKGGRKENG